MNLIRYYVDLLRSLLILTKNSKAGHLVLNRRTRPFYIAKFYLLMVLNKQIEHNF